MNRERLLESILYISNYNYKAVFERFPVLNTIPWAPQHRPAFLDIKAELKIVDDEGPYSFAQLEWSEIAPIYKINKFYYSHLQTNGVFNNAGHLLLTDSEIQNIDRIEAWIEMDTEPWCKVKLFTCSDIGIIDSLADYDEELKKYDLLK